MQQEVDDCFEPQAFQKHDQQWRIIRTLDYEGRFTPAPTKRPAQAVLGKCMPPPPPLRQKVDDDDKEGLGIVTWPLIPCHICGSYFGLVTS